MDRCFGGFSVDRCFGDFSVDRCFGGFSVDRCFGSFSVDRCFGSFSVDRCFGAFSVDRLTGVEVFSANHLVRLAISSLILSVVLVLGLGSCKDQASAPEKAVSTPGDRWVTGVPLWPAAEKSPFRKEPKWKDLRAYGMVDLGEGKFPFAVHAFEKSMRVDTVLFDLNRNGDLTDDPKIRPGSGSNAEMLTFLLPGGRSIKARLQGGAGSMFGMSLCPVETHRIRVNLGGREYDALLRDSGFDGLKQGASTDDFMMLDLNGDGRFDDGPGGMQPEGFTYLGNLVWLNGDLWFLTLDSKTPAVSFRPYSGASGQLALEIDLPEPWKETGLLARFTGTSGFLSSGAARTVVSLSKPAPIRLPAVSYSYLTLALSAETPGQPAQVLNLSATGDKLRIENGKTLTLKIAAPKSISVKVQQMGRMLGISKGETRAGDFDWGSMLSTLSDMDGASGGKSPAPTARIYRASQSSASPIGKGTMEYG